MNSKGKGAAAVALILAATSMAAAIEMPPSRSRRDDRDDGEAVFARGTKPPRSLPKAAIKTAHQKRQASKRTRGHR